MATTSVTKSKARLCKYCSRIIPINHRGHTSRAFYFTLAELFGQLKPCYLCEYLRDHIPIETSLDQIALSVRVKEPHSSEDEVQWALLEVSTRVVITGGERNKTHTFSITTCPLTSSKSSRTLRASSMSIGNKISIIKEWFQICETNHGHYCTPSTQQMPKRLIQIDSGPGIPSSLVLVAALSTPSQRYTTLTHCWGARPSIRTLTSNLAQFSHEIPYHDIPPTFHDAIAITRALGISYLWIDALCIVQDDPQEWEQEAPKMTYIYSGSFLNIAASVAPGSEAGCFAGDSIDQVFSINAADGSGFDSELLVRLQPGDTRRLTREAVISSRGWTLQEQLLAHRMVSCMSSELHWECSAVYESNTGAQFRQAADVIRDVPRLHQNASELRRKGVWWSWMRNFSERKFTFWKDRLPALAGLIQFYQEVTEDVPLLGLWKSSLIRDLLWVRLDPLPASPPTLQYDANLPSWSWLSCPTRITFDMWQLTMTTTQSDPYITEEIMCQLMDYDIEWLGMPWVSIIKSAYIVLQGPVTEFHIDVDKTAPQSDPPVLRLTGFVQSITCTAQFDGGGVQIGQFTCLFLHRRTHSQTKAQRNTFLILAASATTLKKYRRVGIGCSYDGRVFAETKKQHIRIE